MRTFTGIYVGEVVSNTDDYMIGRLKVKVPMVYGNIAIDDLPWAEPCFPYGSNDKGIFFIPEVGSLVCVTFLNGSEYRPVWLGSIFRDSENIIPQEASTAYPNRKIIKTTVGYVMFDDENDYIEIKHRNGTCHTMTPEGDYVIHSKRDTIILSDRYVIIDPVGHENVIPIPIYKSQSEKDLMSEAELNEYENAMEEYVVKTEGNCGSQGKDEYVVGSLGTNCKSQAGSLMRQWGATQRSSQSMATKNNYLTSVRSLSRHTNKKTSGVNLRFTDSLATKIESALDEMQITEPELYSTFTFTDGFRAMNSTGKGALYSMHKYGGAFDFNYSAFGCEDREKVYEILAKHGICCPLDSWSGQDEGMHMEIARECYNA